MHVYLQFQVILPKSSYRLAAGGDTDITFQVMYDRLDLIYHTHHLLNFYRIAPRYIIRRQGHYLDFMYYLPPYSN